MNCNSCNSPEYHDFSKPSCFFTKTQLTVVKCSDCGLIFLNPRPDKKLGLEYFENAYSNALGFEDISYYRDLDLILRRNKVRFESINKLPAPNRKILDFGAGQGHFVKIASDQNWFAQGIEHSIAGQNSAKQNLGIDLLSSVNELNTSDFGIITLWDVIEHLEDPKQTIIELSQYLHPKGYFIIETSNIDSLDYIVHKKKWSYWHIDHLFYYSKTSINFLFHTMGFRQIINYTIDNTVKKSKSELFKKLIKMLSPKNFYLSLKLRLISYKYKDFDVKSLMTVVFQKNES